MSVLRKVLLGAIEALAGAYVGAILFLLILASKAAPPATDTPRADLGWDGVVELVTLAAGGVLALVWWIVPVGAMFNLMLKPRIRSWVRSTATLSGSAIGLGLGLITAALLR
jgi:hypothetical protein